MHLKSAPGGGTAGRRGEGALGGKRTGTREREKGPLCLLHSAHTARPRLVRGPLWEEPVVGVPCEHPARPAGDHPDIHGPADHGRHCQPEGKQAEGKAGARSRGTTSLFPKSQKEQRVCLSKFWAVCEAKYEARRLSSGVCGEM